MSKTIFRYFLDFSDGQEKWRPYVKGMGQIMPLAIQCHHAVCDGFHVGKFVDALRRMAANAEAWLGGN
ncbi:hypothetical protein AT727_19690 [Desulfitobacterium hafniense]|uniref:Chloramphenicol acetyltransferase n=1 Tax=Desulfitobacterium hafniense TaxID=49338 RepID=A0A0W1JKN3_DESHA|nr:CatA-like O-acetyltransferase [Desulfitobacterium hafniense]KTE92410.1 hypothetical protein AT727_19690 [Desulfitobacterium hafniense]